MSLIHSGCVHWLLLNIALLSRISATGGTCSRSFSSAQGTISSPNFPHEYSSLENCSYKISVLSGRKILLLFQDFELEKHTTCYYDNVSIHDGVSTSAQTLGPFCGSAAPPSFLSSTNQVTIDFRSDHSGQYKGFSATFQTVTCGHSLALESGSFSSPNYPNQYDPNAKCIYLIRILEGRVVLLSFSTFQLEQADNCEHDYVKVYDGGDFSSPLRGTFCGFSSPPRIISSTNEMLIEFHSNSRNQNKGFQISYKTAQCVRNYISDEGTFTSPNYPDIYKENEECFFRIGVPEGYRILLSFQNFELERHRSCSFDYIRIYDGATSSSPYLSNLCGFTIPRPILLSGNKAIVMFRTDGTNQYRGFSAKFRKVKCGGTFSSENGTISTPNFPNKYNPNERCLYTIKVPGKSIVLLSFQVFELETQEQCGYDSIKIYDGNVDLGTFCGSKIPGSIVSSGNSVTIDFSSDDSNEYKGFSANFKAGILCATSTCENGGTCIQDELSNTSYCICRHGYRGLKCEEKMLCSNDTCKNGGICTQDGLEGIVRCSCQHGYQGLLCDRSALCDSDTCKNGGTCTQDGLSGSFSCTCRPGYGGLKCTEKILCSDDTCQNRGICSQDKVNDVVRCKCQHGYEGDVCDQNILCADDTCENGGTCTQDGENGVFRCSCQDGYQGSVCERKTECDSATCRNGGTCTQDGLNGLFRCTCRHGYGGPRCEERITCDTDTCKNGGFCIQDELNEIVRCACRHGYQGLKCDERIMCRDNPCKNGGSCTQDETDVYRCTCQFGYSGVTCEEIGSSFVAMFYIGIVGTVMGTITCILAFIVIAMARKIRSRGIPSLRMEKGGDFASPDTHPNEYELIKC